MKKDNIDNLFEKLEGTFNSSETPKGHQHRFLNKLNTQNRAKKEGNFLKFTLKKVFAIAVIFALILTVSGLFFKTKTITTADLASISPEMEKTQSFFTNAINSEVKKIKKITSPETKVLVQDALKQLEILEKNYQSLKLDLVRSGNDKRVIYAMISNFQKRVALLKQVITKIEEIKTLNIQKNENTL